MKSESVWIGIGVLVTIVVAEIVVGDLEVKSVLDSLTRGEVVFLTIAGDISPEKNMMLPTSKNWRKPTKPKLRCRKQRKWNQTKTKN